MRVLIFILAAMFFCGTATAELTAEQWEADLQELVTKIEEIHPDPYHHVSRDAFYKQVKMISAGIPKAGAIDIQMEFLLLVSMLRDRHTALHPVDPGGFNHWLPLYFYRFNDGFYVTSATAPYKDLLGKRILKMGCCPAEKVFQAVADLHSSDSDVGRLQNTYYMSSLDVLKVLTIADDTNSIKISYEELNGTVSKMPVEAVEIPYNLQDTKSYGEMFGPSDKGLFPSYHMPYQGLNVEQWLRKPLAEKADIPHFLRTRSGYWYEYLADQKTLYMAIAYSTHNGRHGYQSFRTFLDEAFGVVDTNPVEKFILDVRFNPGGDGSITLPLVHEFIKRDAINQKGRLFVLTGRKTYSAAQMIYAEMIKHTNAMLVGEPAGAPVNGYGDPGTYYLSNSGMELNISTAYWQMGHPNDESWYPEINLPFEFSGTDYTQGKDRAMEYLLNLEAPYLSLPQLLRNSSVEEYQEEAARRQEMFGQFDWWKTFSERDMRFAARELYDEREHEKGELGFQSLVKQYPESWRAWRDYADRLIKARHFKKARLVIESGLKVAPDNTDLLALKAKAEEP